MGDGFDLNISETYDMKAPFSFGVLIPMSADRGPSSNLGSAKEKKTLKFNYTLINQNIFNLEHKRHH